MSVMDTHCSTVKELLDALEGSNDLSKIEQNCNEAEETLAEMKIEIHSISNRQQKDTYIAKMAEFQKQINRYKKQLLTGQSSTLSSVNRSTQESLASQEQRQQNSLDILKQAQQQLAQSEEQAINTRKNLAQQKETIQHTRANLQESNQQLSYGNKLLNRMNQWWRG